MGEIFRDSAPKHAPSEGSVDLQLRHWSTPRSWVRFEFLPNFSMYSPSIPFFTLHQIDYSIPHDSWNTCLVTSKANSHKFPRIPSPPKNHLVVRPNLRLVAGCWHSDSRDEFCTKWKDFGYIQLIIHQTNPSIHSSIYSISFIHLMYHFSIHSIFHHWLDQLFDHSLPTSIH